MPYKDPEKQRAYNKTPAKKKSFRISKWKSRGIISDDYDALYDRFMTTTHCETCDVLLTTGGRNTRTTKCVDHDHSIKDRYNVRAILCLACNSNDDSKNTSGVPNVSYSNPAGRWRYHKMVAGVVHTKYFNTKKDAIRYKFHYECCQSIIVAEDQPG